MSQQRVPVESGQYSQSNAGNRSDREQQRTSRQSATEQFDTPQRSGGIAAPAGRQFPTRSYLDEQTRTASIGILNQCLADLASIHMQIKDAHWNVKGEGFYQLHELFEDLAELFDEHIDTVAERASALGGQALGSAHDVVENSTVPRPSRGAVDGQTLVEDLAYRLSILDATLYHQIETATQCGDLDTADLLNEVSRGVSKAQWFLEAHLQGPPARTQTPPGSQSAPMPSTGSGQR